MNIHLAKEKKLKYLVFHLRSDNNHKQLHKFLTFKVAVAYALDKGAHVVRIF